VGTADRRCGEATVVPRKWVERAKAERGVEDGRRHRGSVLQADDLTGSYSSVWRAEGAVVP
jgi:hypothetical protein